MIWSPHVKHFIRFRPRISNEVAHFKWTIAEGNDKFATKTAVFCLKLTYFGKQWPIFGEWIRFNEVTSSKFQYDCSTQSVNLVIYTKHFNELFICLQLFLYQYLFIDYWSCHLLLHNLYSISNSGRKRNNLLLIEYKLYWTKHLNWSLDRLSIAWKSGQSSYYIAEVTSANASPCSTYASYGMDHIEPSCQMQYNINIANIKW